MLDAVKPQFDEQVLYRGVDAPFFIAEEITGFESSPTALLAEPYLANAQKLAARKWSLLGEIAR